MTFNVSNEVPGLDYPEQDCLQQSCLESEYPRQNYPGSATRAHAVLSQEPGAGPAPEIWGPGPGGVAWKAPASVGNRGSGVDSFPGLGRSGVDLPAAESPRGQEFARGVSMSGSHWACFPQAPFSVALQRYTESRGLRTSEERGGEQAPYYHLRSIRTGTARVPRRVLLLSLIHI